MMCFTVSEFIVIWMVELAHEAVDVGRGIAPYVRNEESNELRRDVVKHWAVNIDFCQDLPCEVNSSNISQSNSKVHLVFCTSSGVSKQTGYAHATLKSVLEHPEHFPTSSLMSLNYRYTAILNEWQKSVSGHFYW